MKYIEAWAVVDKYGQLCIRTDTAYDGCPYAIYHYKLSAERGGEPNSDDRVVRVKIEWEE